MNEMDDARREQIRALVVDAVDDLLIEDERLRGDGLARIGDALERIADTLERHTARAATRRQQ